MKRKTAALFLAGLMAVSGVISVPVMAEDISEDFEIVLEQEASEMDVPSEDAGAPESAETAGVSAEGGLIEDIGEDVSIKEETEADGFEIESSAKEKQKETIGKSVSESVNHEFTESISMFGDKPSDAVIGSYFNTGTTHGTVPGASSAVESIGKSSSTFVNKPDSSVFSGLSEAISDGTIATNHDMPSGSWGSSSSGSGSSHTESYGYGYNAGSSHTESYGYGYNTGTSSTQSWSYGVNTGSTSGTSSSGWSYNGGSSHGWSEAYPATDGRPAFADDFSQNIGISHNTGSSDNQSWSYGVNTGSTSTTGSSSGSYNGGSSHGWSEAYPATDGRPASADDLSQNIGSISHNTDSSASASTGKPSATQGTSSGSWHSSSTNSGSTSGTTTGHSESHSYSYGQNTGKATGTSVAVGNGTSVSLGRSSNGVSVTSISSNGSSVSVPANVAGQSVREIASGAVSGKSYKSITLTVNGNTKFGKSILKDKKARKAKSVRITSTNGKLRASNFNKKAFKGYKGKLIISKKSMTKKEFNKLKKKLKKGGMKGKIVRK